MDDKNKYKERCMREGCTRLICDRIHPKFGGLCNECFEDFKDYMISVNYMISIECGDDHPSRYIKAFLKHPKEFKFSSRYSELLYVESAADKLFPLKSER